MRNFATGVCVATTYIDDLDGRRHDALTVNSLTSLSLDPPLVSLALRADSAFLADLLVSKVWALSILDVGGDDLARSFAADRAHRTTALSTATVAPGEQTGALILESQAWLECVLREQIDTGDHTMVIGEVVATGSKERRPPLIFLRGKYYALGECRAIAPCADPSELQARPELEEAQ
jgi:flavin reductase (DIM6/NTAB) family NADH-FMN oxidoreductase RutF